MKKLRRLLLLFSVVLPNSLKKIIYKSFFGWKIGKNVRIGLSFIDADKVILEDNVKIGHFNFVKGLKIFELGTGSSIMNYNHFNSGKKEWDNSFILGKNCGITSRHTFDSCGGLYIGNDVVIAGSSTQIWSHEVVLAKKKIFPKPVHIGSNIYIGSSVLLSPGVVIPSNCVVGLGTVVPSKFKCEEGSLIVGNPATVKKKHNEENNLEK